MHMILHLKNGKIIDYPNVNSFKLIKSDTSMDYYQFGIKGTRQFYIWYKFEVLEITGVEE